MANSDWDSEREDVSRLAYQYWVDGGCQDGNHDGDWARAEAEIRRRRGEPARPARTVVGVFRTIEDARNAYQALEKEGFDRSAISCLANGQGAEAVSQDTPAPADRAGEVAVDTGLGAAIGGVGGFLLGFAAFAVPGIGPVLGAGPIIAALGGAGMGAMAGSLVGALGDHGIPEEDAKVYTEGVRRGHVLITVSADAERADRAAQIMDENKAIDINDHVSGWRKRGWSGFDPNAKPLSMAELRRERDYYKQAQKQANEWRRESAEANAASRLTRVYERM